MKAKACAAKPCAGCPFRRNSLRGWLGGYGGPEEFLTAHLQGEMVNPCHLSMDDYPAGWLEDFVAGRLGQKCMGQAVFFANNMKLPRNPDIERVDQDKKAVFTWSAEFIEHHGREE